MNQTVQPVSKSSSGLWDRLGILMSTLCLVHCLLVPLALFFFPVAGGILIDSMDNTHRLLLLLIFLIAILAFYMGYRIHRQKRPLVWMLVGLGFILLANFVVHNWLGLPWEVAFNSLGSFFLIRAHILNRYHCRTCQEASSGRRCIW